MISGNLTLSAAWHSQKIAETNTEQNGRKNEKEKISKQTLGSTEHSDDDLGRGFRGISQP
jgi:hypothetical protein